LTAIRTLEEAIRGETTRYLGGKKNVKRSEASKKEEEAVIERSNKSKKNVKL